jgi:hypothetical protein
MILGGDIYHMHTKKKDLYLKKEHRGIIPGGAMVTWGICSMCFQHYIRVMLDHVVIDANGLID